MAVALYARVSTVKQAEKDLSIPDQLKQMRDWCKKNGDLIAHEYIEPGASATDDRRPVFQEMIGDATQHPSPFEAIIVHSLSRFFRDSIEFGIYERRLTKCGVHLLSITQQTSDDPSGHMARKIFSIFDEYQSKENGKHTLRAMKENARQGYFNGSNPSYGYKAVVVPLAGKKHKKKKLEIDHAEAETVRTIFELYIHGDKGRPIGMHQIAKLLNAKGISKRGTKWEKSYVHQVLSNTAYMGHYYFNKHDGKTMKLKPESEWILLEVPPVIEEHLFHQAASLRKECAPTKVPGRILSSPALLAGLIKCGRCGAGMTLATGRSGRYKYYKCNARHKDCAACDTRNIPMETLDQLILDAMAEKVCTFDRVKNMLAKLYDYFKSSFGTNERKVRALNKELTENKQKMERLYEAVESGKLPHDDTLSERARKHQVRRQEILIEIARLNSAKEVPLAKLGEGQIKAYLKAFKSHFTDTKSGLGRQYVRMLVDEVKVVGNTIQVKGSNAKLALAVGGQNAGVLVPRIGLKWLATKDSNLDKQIQNLLSYP